VDYCARAPEVRVAGGTAWLGETVTAAKTKELQDLLAPSLASLGYELVQLRLLSGNRPTLQILAEPLNGGTMNVDDCTAVSRHVSAVLDVEDPIAGAYDLEVGSPGIDRPLVKAADYERFKGEEAKIETAAPLNGRKRFRGILEGVDGTDVRIKVDDQTYSVPLGAIQAAKLVLTNELIARDAKRRAAARNDSGQSV
jgi:ribosome maturation factor RimP